MGFKYAIRSDRLHFLTHTVVDWVDVFTRKELALVVVDSLNFCVENKGLEVYAWCLMPSHLHMISAGIEGDKDSLSRIMRDFKKFTSKNIVKEIRSIDESRREWLLKHFQTGVDSFQVWQEGMHPVELTTKKFTNQKMDYIHNNPVEVGIVDEPHHYLLSSARDYWGNRKGLITLRYIE